MNDNPRRAEAPTLRSATPTRHMPELFGPHVGRYAKPIILKTCNEISSPRTTSMPLVPAHILRRRLADIFDLIERPNGPWVHVGEFLFDIPTPTRNVIIRHIASSMAVIERKTGWRMPPENFCALLSDLPQHIKMWLVNEHSRPIGLEAFSAFLARSHRQALITGKTGQFACDLELPEVAAISQGPDAVRACAAEGGDFTLDFSHTGCTLAHVAATATYQWPNAVAAFIEVGGIFHDEPDRMGRTPAHTLICEAASPEAIRLTAAAGVRLTSEVASLVDSFGTTLLTTAVDRGPEFREAVTDWLAVGDASS